MGSFTSFSFLLFLAIVKVIFFCSLGNPQAKSQIISLCFGLLFVYLPLTVLEKILLCSIMYSRYQNAYVLIPGISEYITLYGKKDFVGIVKVNCLEMKLPWNILVGLI